MLRIVIGDDMFDEETQRFSIANELVIDLEHSLVSLSKWEQKYLKPFLDEKPKTGEEMLYYFECMVLTPGITQKDLVRFSQANFQEVNEYIQSPATATTFYEPSTKGKRGETITSELIYYWMVTFQIPFDAETWHLNRLFALIRVLNIKNGKQKKMSRGEVAHRNRMLNEQRRKDLGTSG